MTILRFTVPTIPVSQPRARATAIGGHARVYEPATVKDSFGQRQPHPIATFKATVKQSAQAILCDRPPFDGPVAVHLVFRVPRPPSMVWKRRPMPRAAHVNQKPGDIDNLAKAVLDALNGITWEDDRAVWLALIQKVVCAADEGPCVEITIGFGIEEAMGVLSDLALALRKVLPVPQLLPFENARAT